MATIEAARAEDALEANGMTGAALLKLAYQAANTYARNHPAFPVSRLEDLAMHCCVVVCRRAPGYDPDRNPGFDPTLNPRSTPFRSWVWLQMQGAIGDFVRRRDQGFPGRLGRDKPIVVTPGLEETHADPLEAFDDMTAKRSEADRWRAAAQRKGITLEAFIREALDQAAA